MTKKDGGEPVHHEVAHSILGEERFFGVADWLNYYSRLGLSLSKEQLRQVEKFPWGAAALNQPCKFYRDKEVKETHFAFLGIVNINNEPLTIMALHELPLLMEQPNLRFSDPWYKERWFAAKRTCRFRWYLMLSEIIPGSEDKPRKEQFALLPEHYRIPSAIEVVVKNILYFRKNKVYSNQFRWGRCLEPNTFVGRFGRYGQFIERYWDGASIHDLGIHAMLDL